MSNSQTSRRVFLGSMAILSAGAAFGSVTKLFSVNDPAIDLKKQWEKFCSQNAGKQTLTAFANSEITINQCQGHTYKIGSPVYFNDQEMVAQPTWIYWGNDINKPADVVVTFYKNDDTQKKLFRINRFELEGLNALSEKEKNTLMADLKKITTKHANKNEKTLEITTRIVQGRKAEIVATLPKKEISIKRNLIL
jgi:hypothetical protein